MLPIILKTQKFFKSSKATIDTLRSDLLSFDKNPIAENIAAFYEKYHKQMGDIQQQRISSAKNAQHVNTQNTILFQGVQEIFRKIEDFKKGKSSSAVAILTGDDLETIQKMIRFQQFLQDAIEIFESKLLQEIQPDVDVTAEQEAQIVHVTAEQKAQIVQVRNFYAKYKDDISSFKYDPLLNERKIKEKFEVLESFFKQMDKKHNPKESNEKHNPKESKVQFTEEELSFFQKIIKMFLEKITKFFEEKLSFEGKSDKLFATRISHTRDSSHSL